MYEFLSENSLYVVMVIVVVIWAGFFFYLFRLDRKLHKIEEQR